MFDQQLNIPHVHLILALNYINCMSVLVSMLSGRPWEIPWRGDALSQAEGAISSHPDVFCEEYGDSDLCQLVSWSTWLVFLWPNVMPEVLLTWRDVCWS